MKLLKQVWIEGRVNERKLHTDQTRIWTVNLKMYKTNERQHHSPIQVKDNDVEPVFDFKRVTLKKIVKVNQEND